MHLNVNFWLDRTRQPDELLAGPAEISELVRNAFQNDPSIVDLTSYPETLFGNEISDLIVSMSKPHSEDLFYRNGGTVNADDYARYTRNLNLDDLSDSDRVRFGLTLRRADLRKWPTTDAVFKTHATFDLDRFQESGLFPADAVAVLHESADREWYFVQSYNYAAWVRKELIVIGDRESIMQYRGADNFLIVSGGKVSTNFNPNHSAISELQLDMGVRLPLLDAEAIERDVDGQSPRSSYAVSLPVRDDRDGLRFRTALIARNQDVRVGHMPFTRKNVLHQSFKFLGERYGWGHAYNARDCSGFVMEVYKTFGILLPRNSLQQSTSPVGRNIVISASAGAEEKLQLLAGCDVGDLLYSPGHVMVYLGNVDGDPYVIHSLFGAGWTDDNGKFQDGALNGVSVTPLMRTYADDNATYFDQLSSIKKIRVS